MKKILTLIRNKWRQYMNHIFLVDTNNHFVHYSTVLLYILAIDELLAKRLKYEQPSVILVSDNLLIKSIVFVYCFITNIDLTLISPKFTLSEICNAVTGKRESNTLILDAATEARIKQYENEEGVSVLKYIKVVITTSKLAEIVSDASSEIDDNRLNKLHNMGVRNIYNNYLYVPKVSVLSPGTSTQSVFTNVPYEIMAKSMQIMSYFMGLKKDDRITVIADFEFFPNIFTLLGFLNGLTFVQPVYDIKSAEDYVDQMKHCKMKPSVVLITSAKFKLLWDSVVLKVYGNKLFFFLSKIGFLEWIPRGVILRQLSNVFGSSVKKIHILNEELGFSCLEMLRHSRRMTISSSYGYLEQGNFLAFKDPTMFRHKKYFDKPGGSVLLDSPELFDFAGVDRDNWVKEIVNSNGDSKDKAMMGEIVVKSKIGDHTRLMQSGDMGMEIKNLPNQGQRKYLMVLGRKERVSDNWGTSIDFAERCVKDTLFVRDCFFIKVKEGYHLYLEPREDLLELQQVGWQEVTNAAELLVGKLVAKKLNVIGYSVLRFSGFRNIVDKLQYWTFRG